jgi:hypothetical protein
MSGCNCEGPFPFFFLSFCFLFFPTGSKWPGGVVLPVCGLDGSRSPATSPSVAAPSQSQDHAAETTNQTHPYVDIPVSREMCNFVSRSEKLPNMYDTEAETIDAAVAAGAEWVQGAVGCSALSSLPTSSAQFPLPLHSPSDIMPGQPAHGSKSSLLSSSYTSLGTLKPSRIFLINAQLCFTHAALFFTC